MINKLEYVRATKIWLKDHPDFDEAWLRDTIAKDPSILGLGELDLLQIEKKQPRAGRLDLLLQDSESEKRYEVELMLGQVDESHIIRCIEYWDIERKRYPNYEHCAVLVAEDITSRFLNVISLLHGAIPIIALQLDAIQILDKIALQFTKLLDETNWAVAESEEEGDPPGEAATRSDWEERTSPISMQIMDKCLEILKEIDSELTLRYNKYFVGIFRRNRPKNFVIFHPKRKFTNMEIRLDDLEPQKDKFQDTTIDSNIDKNSSRLRLHLTEKDPTEHHDLLKQVMTDAYKQWNER